MAGSRILVGAVSHEVRNVCGAIGMIYENLVRHGALNGNKDFEALGSLVETLNKIASLELKQSTAASRRWAASTCPKPWTICASCSTPYARRPVSKSAGRSGRSAAGLGRPPQPAAGAAEPDQEQRAGAGERGGQDESISPWRPRKDRWFRSGSPIPGPASRSTDKLFQPFQKGADSTGLGLYLSRAFVRSFRGDLRHDPSVPGCSFVIELAVAGPRAESAFGQAGTHGTHTTVIA